MVKKIQMFGGVRESIMRIFRCHIKKINGYISLGNQRDLILDWIKKKYQVESDEIFECLGTQIIDNSSFQVMDYSPVILGEKTFVSIRGSKFTLVNPSGPKKMRIYWYFDDLYIEDWRDTEFVNLLEDREESDEIITTDFTLPKNHIDYLLLTPESEEPELVREIGRLRDKDYSYRRIKGEISDLMGIQVSHTKIKRIIQKYHSFQSQM